MPARREFPRSPIQPSGDNPEAWLDGGTPTWGGAPSTTADLELRDRIQDAIDLLTPEERFVFDGWVVERLTLAQLGQMMAKTKWSAIRTRDRAVRKLNELLVDDERIQGWLKR